MFYFCKLLKKQKNLAAKSKSSETPLMKQYYGIKAKHPDAVLLFRVGDFYETFEADAVKTAEILGITLTKRANGAASYVDLAGFPYHALDTYLPKLVRAGQRVAICEQLEDPKLAKKIVKRGITELVTPGISLNDNVLNHRENNFLASVYLDKNFGGIAFLDISTGEFLTAQGNTEYIDKLLNNFQPKEVLFQKQKESEFYNLFSSGFHTYPLDEWVYNEEFAREKLQKQFETSSLKGFGIHSRTYGIVASSAILHYLELTQHHQLSHISTISRIEEERYVWLDKFTIRNLELFHALHEGGKSFIDILDATVTPMGARLLKRWIALPLKDTQPVNDRLDVTEFFLKNNAITNPVVSGLKQIGDLERLSSKIALLRINPREVVHLKNALKALEPIRKTCLEAACLPLKKLAEQLNVCETISRKIEQEIMPDPPNQVNKGNVIADNVSEELDELRRIIHSGKDYLVELQQKLTESTGIPSLKISFNNVFGYYIEVRNTHKAKVPQEWIRKQTLVSAERYITSDLKEYEEKILGAEEKILALETKLFNNIVLGLVDYIPAFQLNASIVAQIDCLAGFAGIAAANQYVRPEVNDSDVIDIKEGRHPVIERQLPVDEPYIANDVLLDKEDQQIIIVTGPNMAGKSALLRQTALIVLMAQTGSFVPAKSAKIGVVDKIFTRVGASDNISLGESTFMVEMNEAASILNNISGKSLILFDELGRGTSTYDGISIAWAIVEYIHENTESRPKTLFATHYHELNEMEKSFPRIKNYNVTVKEVDNKVIFLRRLTRGGSEHSFGIHVAKMAGMPKSIVRRANDILREMEGEQQQKTLAKPVNDLAKQREGYQLSFFQLDDPVLQEIRKQITNLDINNLTPVEALNKLNEIKKLAGK